MSLIYQKMVGLLALILNVLPALIWIMNQNQHIKSHTRLKAQTKKKSISATQYSIIEVTVEKIKEITGKKNNGSHNP